MIIVQIHPLFNINNLVADCMDLIQLPSFISCILARKLTKL